MHTWVKSFVLKRFWCLSRKVISGWQNFQKNICYWFVLLTCIDKCTSAVFHSNSICFPLTSFSRWWCLSTSRIKTCSRSFMRKCWPSVWSTRTAPATMPRPAWSPNWRFRQLALNPALLLHGQDWFLDLWFDLGICRVSLQQACGFEYTSKLQRMFQDIGVSKDLNEQFKKHLTNSEPLDCTYQRLRSPPMMLYPFLKLNFSYNEWTA